jgi:hypothetical protein
MSFADNANEIIGVDAGDMNPKYGVLVSSNVTHWIENDCQITY